MTLLTLTQAPTARQQALFDLMLQPEDALLLRGDARSLVWKPNPTVARGYIRVTDAETLGGQRHPDWQLIHDDEWVKMTTQHQPIINW